MEGVRTGTSHFISLKAVENYYGTEVAQIKLKEGAVSIGKPAITSKQKLVINQSEQRYFIEGL
jgi:hypothetical protein